MKDKGVDIVFNPKTKSNNVLGGIMGLAVADALGYLLSLKVGVH